MKILTNPLRPGDVIRTHPRRGYWGCVVVLSARGSAQGLHPVSHFATTTFVSRTRFEWDEIDVTQLRLLEVSLVFRAAPKEYYRLPPRPDISMHTVTPSTTLDVIGRIDPKQIYPRRITFTVGDGENGKFPLAGPVDKQLGDSAVTAWLEVENPERAEQTVRRALREMESHHNAIVEMDRMARAKRKASKVTRK